MASASKSGFGVMRLVGRVVPLVVRIRNSGYRSWLKFRYGSRIVLARSAEIPGRVVLQPGCRLRIGEGTIVSDLLELWGSIDVDLGPNNRVIMGVRIFGTGSVVTGNRVLLNGTKINCMTELRIGEESMVGAALIMDSDFHNLAPKIRRTSPQDVTDPVCIGANVWIGYGSLVLKGVTIGNDSVIGAGSVVRSNVPVGVVVSGNPATVVKTFEAHERKFL